MCIPYAIISISRCTSWWYCNQNHSIGKLQQLYIDALQLKFKPLQQSVWCYSVFASHSTISNSFNPFSKVLCIFPSRYLCTTSLKLVFSLIWNLPHDLHSNPKKRELPIAGHIIADPDTTWDYHPCCWTIPRYKNTSCKLAIHFNITYQGTYLDFKHKQS